MTFAELRALTSVWLDDVSNGYFTAAQVNVWLNNGQREVQKKLLNSAEDYYTKCVYSSTVANQKSYAFPDDFLKIMRLERVTSGSGDTATTQKMNPLTRNEQDLILGQPAGTPWYYYINKNSFSLVPTPDSVVEMHLYFAYRVADMVNDSDEPDVPKDYHELIALYATRDGFLRDGRDLSGFQLKIDYYERLMAENAEQRDQSSPRYVVATDVDMW